MNVPVYVSRKRPSDGMIFTLDVNIWIVVVLLLIALANAFGWGLYGLYALADKIL